MKLEFDSISDLEQFLMFAAHIGRAFAVAPPPESILPEGAIKSPAESKVPAYDMPEGDAFVAETAAASAEVDKPKRTRRTKAEMEAARAAETGIEGGGLLPKIAEDTSPAGANPFAIASPATQAILEAPNQSAATLAGMAAMQTPPAEEPAAAPRVIESIEHLRACQSFIQAHGMTKYNESFQGGLNANIAAYTPEQRAQHVAILETLGA